MIKGLIFDYGGTLDTAARHWSYIIHDGYRHAGVELTQEVFREAYVYAERALAKVRYIVPQDDFFSLLYKKISIEIEYLIAHDRWKPSSFQDIARVNQEVAVYCDCVARSEVQASSAVLKTLSQKYKMVIVSNFYGNLSKVMENYHIAHYFDCIVESAVVGYRKPNPEIYRLGVEALHCLPQECVVIGDSYKKDIIPASEVGCQTVWFKGQEWEDINYDESKPGHIIYKLKELLQIL